MELTEVVTSQPWAPQQTPQIEEAYTREELLAYLEWLQRQLPEMVAALDLGATASGFDWIPLNKLELQFYKIRHLQHHADELCDRLGREASVEADWVGMVHGE